MNCLQKTSQEMRFPALSSNLLIVLLLAACGSPAPRPGASTGTIAQPLAISEKGNEVALYALGLIDTGYRFGGPGTWSSSTHEAGRSRMSASTSAIRDLFTRRRPAGAFVSTA